MTENLTRIEKRAVEARALAPYVEALSRRIGRDEALAVLREVHEREAFERGRRQARTVRDTIADLVDEVEGWGEGGIWEMTVLERTATTYHFDVTRCPYHEKYVELGVADIGVELSCCRDAPHARGFDPRLELVRTRTLMEGHDRCDFRYRLRDDRHGGRRTGDHAGG